MSDSEFQVGEVVRYSTLRVSKETLMLLSDEGFVDADEALKQFYELTWEQDPKDPSIVAGVYYNAHVDMFHPTLLLDEAAALQFA